MRMNNSLHIYPVVFIFVSACLSSLTVSAGERLPREMLDMKRRKYPLEKLLDSAAVNMDKIKALYLSPGYGFDAMVFDRISKALGKTQSTENKTALHILLAAELKAKKMDANMPDRNKEISYKRRRLSKNVLEEVLGYKEDANDELAALLKSLLADFTELPDASDNSRLFKALFETVGTLLADKNVAVRMSEKDKADVLEKYLKSDRKPLGKAKPSQVVGIYKNLGFMDELRRLCVVASNGNETVAELERKMGIAASAGFADEAIACADRLLEFVEKKGKIPCHGDVVATYARFRPTDALVKFKGGCDDNHTTTVVMYRAACAADQHGDEAKRRSEWLGDYIGKAEKNSIRNGELDKARQLVRLNSLAYELEANDCHDAALYVADRIMETSTLIGEKRIVATLQLVERCNKVLGRHGATKKIFTKFLENKELDEDARRFASAYINHTDNNNYNEEEK